jgi:hypothetical protein
MKNRLILMLVLVILVWVFSPFSVIAAPANQGEDPKTRVNRLYGGAIKPGHIPASRSSLLPA